MFGVGIVITAIFDNVNRNFPNKKGNYTKIKKPVTIAIKQYLCAVTKTGYF